MNPHVKNTIFIVLIVGTLVAAFFITLKTHSDNPVLEPIEEQLKLSIKDNPIKYDACTKVGGDWIKFSNACANLCEPSVACIFTITYSCDCGDNKCWDESSKNCISI